MQCIVSGCEHNASTSYGLGITFYMVPTEPTLRKKWFQSVGADGCRAPEVSMVCSDHFLPEDLYTKGGQRRLRADAIPVVQISLDTIKAANENQRNSSLSVISKVDQYDLEHVHIKKELEDVHENNNETDRLKDNIVVLEISKNRKSNSEINDSYPPNLHEETDLDVKMENDTDDTEDTNNDNDTHINENGNSETSENSLSKPVIVYIKSEKCMDDNESRDDADEDVSLASLRHCNPDGRTDQIQKITKKDPSKERDGDMGRLSRATGLRTTSMKDTEPHLKRKLRIPRLKSMKFKNDCLLQAVNTHTQPRNYSCRVCKKDFRSEITLSKHLPLHFKAKKFTCEYCNKTFDLERQLKRHLLIHDRKKYACDLCQQCFKDEFNLNVHVRIHNGEKPYICDFCNSTFRDKSDLRKHLKNHYNIKPFACDLCEKRFSIKSKLKRHVMTHFYRKQYVCPLCSKSFRGEKNLKIHLDIHRGVKPFSCELCKAAFKDKRDLRKHLIIHTGLKPFACDLCDKSFGMKSKLSRHIATHSGAKPYKCGVCSKSFSEKGNLQKHSRIHTNTKSYSCDLCKKSFVENSVLKRHIRVHMR